MPVFYGQCLCGPKKHVICACYLEKETAAEVESALRQEVERALLQGYPLVCPECGEDWQAWVYPIERSPYKNMAEVDAMMQRVMTRRAMMSSLFEGRGRQN